MTRFLVLTLSFAVLGLAQDAHIERKITFNGRTLTSDQMARLEAVERYYGVRIMDRSYFYDNRSGAVGFWHGPVIAALPAGLELGGPMPEDASDGRTGVVVNGRRLHRDDVRALSQIIPVRPGRYWVDGQGNFGYEGGPMVGNLFLLARQSNANTGQHRVYSAGEIAGIIVNPAGACTSSGCYYR